MIDVKMFASQKTELSQYKARVAKVARAYAKQYQWCDVVDEALAELDIVDNNIC